MSTAETFALLEAAQSGDEEAGERVLRENTGLIWSVHTERSFPPTPCQRSRVKYGDFSVTTAR